MFEQGRALVDGAVDRGALAMLIGRYCILRLSITGSAHELLSHAAEATQIAEELDDPVLRGYIWFMADTLDEKRGHAQSSFMWAARVEREVGSDSRLGMELVGLSLHAASYWARGTALACLGRLAESEAAFDECARSAAEVGDLDVLAWAANGRSFLATASGGAPTFLSAARQAVDTAVATDNGAARSFALSAVGAGCLLNDQTEDARDALRASVESANELRTGRF